MTDREAMEAAGLKLHFLTGVPTPTSVLALAHEVLALRDSRDRVLAIAGRASDNDGDNKAGAKAMRAGLQQIVATLAIRRAGDPE